MKTSSSGSSKTASIVKLLIVLVIVIAGVAVIFKVTSCAEKAAEAPGKSIENVGKAIDITGSILAEIAKNFKTGKVDTEHTSYATKIIPSLRLQVDVNKSKESFYRKESKAYFWEHLPLPDVEVMITVPVTYTYYIDLAGWEYTLIPEKKDIIIYVPDLKSNEPAPDISEMKTIVNGSVFRFDEKDVEEKIKAEITQELKKIAQKNIENLSLRESSRGKIEEFAEDFLKSWFEKNYEPINFDEFDMEIVFKNERSAKTSTH